jgi:hypothetical protein
VGWIKPLSSNKNNACSRCVKNLQLDPERLEAIPEARFCLAD